MENENKYTCILCDQQFSNESTLENHKSSQKHITNLKFSNLINKNNEILSKIENLQNNLLSHTEMILSKLPQLNLLNVENRLNTLLNELNKSNDINELNKSNEINKKENKTNLYNIIGITMPILVSVGYFLMKKY